MIHPIIWIQFSRLLGRRLGLNSEESMALAKLLLNDMRRNSLDIVKGTWLGPDTRTDGINWDDVAEVADQILEDHGGIAPWKPYEG